MNRNIWEYISKNIGENILKYHKCDWCNDEYPLFKIEANFLQKNDFPVSKLCFDCRTRSMIMWRNERKLFWRKSDKTGKKILSMFGDSYKGKVYNYDEWDDCEGFSEINKEIKTDENTLLKYYDLMNEVPKSGTDIFWNNENMWFCNRVGNIKNAYYSFVCFQENEDIYFSYTITKSKDVYNSSNIYSSSLVAESVRIFDSYGVFFSDDIVDSKNIYFSFDLKNCEECLFSSNQISKKYMIFNKQFEKEEYLKMKEELTNSMSSYKTLNGLIDKYTNLKNTSIKKATNLIGSENCIGDQTQNSKNLIYGFGMQGAENGVASHMGFPGPSKNVFSSYGFGLIENMYYTTGSGPVTNGYFCVNIEETTNAYYSQKIKGCNNVAFSIGLQNQDYSILNKKYEKEEYLEKFDEIKNNLKKSGDWGKFFDVSKSPFPINDTTLLDDFPMEKIYLVENYKEDEKIENFNTKQINNNPDGEGKIYVLEPNEFISKAILDFGGEKILNIRYRTREKEVDIPKGIDLIKPNEIEDDINSIDDKILDQAVMCSESNRPYRIIKKELDFYKKYNIAISRIHPDLRISKRNERKPKIGLHLINCTSCNGETVSVYKGDKGYKIYCQDCYDKEILT